MRFLVLALCVLLTAQTPIQTLDPKTVYFVNVNPCTDLALMQNMAKQEAQGGFKSEVLKSYEAALKQGVCFNGKIHFQPVKQWGQYEIPYTDQNHKEAKRTLYLIEAYCNLNLHIGDSVTEVHTIYLFVPFPIQGDAT